MTSTPNSEDLVVVLESQDQTQIAVVRSLLEGAGIPYVVTGHGAGGLEPALNRLASLFTSRQPGTQIKVAAQYAEDAIGLLQPPEDALLDDPEDG